MKNRLYNLNITLKYITAEKGGWQLAPGNLLLVRSKKRILVLIISVGEVVTDRK